MVQLPQPFDADYTYIDNDDNDNDAKLDSRDYKDVRVGRQAEAAHRQEREDGSRGVPKPAIPHRHRPVK